MCSLNQVKLEAQYAAKRDIQLGEIADLRQQVEQRVQEAKSQALTIDSLKGVNEELKVCLSSAWLHLPIKMTQATFLIVFLPLSELPT